jgi:hypothetical protein
VESWNCGISRGFPKTEVLGKQPLNSRFCKALSLKNRRACPKTVPPAVPGTLAHSQLVLGQAQYSAFIVYNNFPFPQGRLKKQEGRSKQGARDILDIRGKYPP